ncbi:MAG: chloride channel protein [Enterococcus sp.]
MIKFNSIFVLYCSILGLLVGAIGALFLLVVNELIHFVWVTIPESTGIPFYPLVIGIVGALLIGLMHSKIGEKYPKTMHDVLAEYKQTKRVAYKKEVSKNVFSSLLILALGASVGPEAALSGIIGGLITWVGDRMKLTMRKRDELVKVGIGAMISTIFHAPLAGMGEAFEDSAESYQHKYVKYILYGLTTAFGYVGFQLVRMIFPSEGVFAIRFSEIKWEKEILLFVIPALIIGMLFGNFFNWCEKICDNLVKNISSVYFRALIGGVVLGILGIASPYFLFSGEHQMAELTANALSYSPLFLLALGFGKSFLTHIGFATGWRGGKIFPAIFASAAVGFAFVGLVPYTPGVLVSIITTASVTIILGSPIVAITLLLFLFPIQFILVILLVAFLTISIQNKFIKKAVSAE